MIHKSIDGMVILDSDGVTGKMIGAYHECEFVQLTLKPGSFIIPHSLDFPVTFYVIEGEGTATIEGEDVYAEKGDLVEVEAGSLRQWSNKGSQTLSLLVIKHMGTDA